MHNVITSILGQLAVLESAVLGLLLSNQTEIISDSVTKQSNVKIPQILPLPSWRVREQHEKFRIVKMQSALT